MISIYIFIQAHCTCIDITNVSAENKPRNLIFSSISIRQYDKKEAVKKFQIFGKTLTK